MPIGRQIIAFVERQSTEKNLETFLMAMRGPGLFSFPVWL